MNQLRMSVALLLALAVLCGCGGENAGPVGDWQGKLAVPGGELTIVLHITRGDDGKLAGTFDSPDQGAFGIAATDVTFGGGKLALKVPSIGGSYEATLQPGDSVLAGTWKQGGAELPFEVRRTTDNPVELARPQEPEKPYPYREEEVLVPNPGAGIELAGTLTLPDSGGPFPAVVLVTGSGPQDRDEQVFGHKPFLVLADHLTRRGIAVLRCDDRGVGRSSGDHSIATTADFATDALAQVAFLRGRTDIDPGRIGIIGHSEGGIIAPIAANASADISFVVLLAGTGVRGDSVLVMQSFLVAKAAGADDSAAAGAMRLQRRVLDIVRGVEDTAQAASEIRALLRDEIDRLGSEEREALQLSEQGIDAQVTAMLSPWFRYFLDHDPAPALRALKVPVLAIIGEKDVQVEPKVNLAAIEGALEAGGNPDYTIRELPGLNHLFQHATTGGVDEYASIEQTLAPEALQLIGDWILARVSR